VAGLFLRPYARAAQRLAEAGHLVSMMPGGVILHVVSVHRATQGGTRARVRVAGTGEYGEAWFRQDRVHDGESAVCTLVEDGPLTGEPDVLCVGDARTSGMLYLLPRGTANRAQRWFDKHPDVR
jgi:hypothetical protein